MEEKANDKSLLLFEVTLSEAYHTSLEKERKTSSCNNSTSPTCGQKKRIRRSKELLLEKCKKNGLVHSGVTTELKNKIKLLWSLQNESQLEARIII